MNAGEGMTYVDVLRLPNAVRVLVPTVVGKFSFAMVSLSLLLLVQTGDGGFAAAGAVAGAFGIGNVVVAPLRARLIDRYGARRVLVLLAMCYAVGMVGIVLAVGSAAPSWAVVTLGAFSGVCTPPLGAVVRGIWALLSPTDGYRIRAYSLDAVVEELIVIVGPLLVGVIVLLPFGPSIAVLAAALAGVLGTLGIAAGPTPKRVSKSRGAADWRSWIGPMRHVRFWPVLLSLTAIGLVLGAAELLAIALGGALGDAGAGVLLACFAVGSTIGGLICGARKWRLSAVLRMVVMGMCATAALLVSGWSARFTYQLVIFGVMGLFVSPSMITGYLASDDAAPVEERTEASALVNTAVNAGAALALALGGSLLDEFTTGVTAACLAAMAGAIIILAIVVQASRGRDLHIRVSRLIRIRPTG